MPGLFESLTAVVVLIAALIVIGCVVVFLKCWRKAKQGQALVITGMNKTTVSFNGAIVYPVINRLEVMDTSVKRIEIERSGKDGLICQDNVRADIRVAFFVRVNKNADDVLRVAQSLGCERASDPRALVDLFDAKFSEALKTVGKRFDFTNLYTDREGFKEQILQIIGTDLNGYVLEDAAIDYLEQTSLDFMNPNNILDSEGIKKITDLTAKQRVLSNHIERDREKTIRKQDVEAQEAILELNRQLAESEEKQKREIANIKAREQAEAIKVQQEERLRAEQARIRTEEELRIAEEQMERQVIVANKNRIRTEKVETERVEKDRLLEVTERERIVELANIEKEKALEQERRLIQDVIRERVVVEKATVAEEEKIKDTRAFAEAERSKRVRIVAAEQLAEEKLVGETRAAESKRIAADSLAKQRVVEAEAEREASVKKGEAMKTLADARAAEEAVIGMSEVNVMKARAIALEEEGQAQANVLEKKAIAEARGIEARAVANEKEGQAQARVLQAKYEAEAEGVAQKADAMKKLDGVGKEHEEFKLRLEKEKEVELAHIHIQRDIAESQASIIRDGLKTAKIEIIGGETMFFDKLANSVVQGRSIDRMVGNSEVLTDIRETFFGGDAEDFKAEMQKLMGSFGVTSEDVKNLSVAAALGHLVGETDDGEKKSKLRGLLNAAKRLGVAGKNIGEI